MTGFCNQVWVTTALNNEDLTNAIVLVASLRNTFTNRKTALITAHVNIRKELRNAAKNAFDFLYNLELDQTTDEIRFKDFACVHAIDLLCGFDKCVYLAPTYLALKNSDDVFDFNAGPSGICLPENINWNASLFLFDPSRALYCALKAELCQRADASLATIMEEWVLKHKDDGMEQRLPEKFCRFFVAQETSLNVFEETVSLVNLAEFSGETGIARLESCGISGKHAAEHWRHIKRHYLTPLVCNNDKTLESIIQEEKCPLPHMWLPIWRPGPALSSLQLDMQKALRKKETRETDKIYPRCWILFHEESSQLSKFLMKKLLQETNHVLVVVTPGKTYFDNLEDDITQQRSFTLNPGQEPDFVQLLSCLKRIHSIEGIAYCWALNSGQSTAQENILKPILYLSKAVLAILKTGFQQLKLVALTNNAATLEGEQGTPVVHCPAATLHGFVKVLCNEQPELCCRAVDVVVDPKENAEEMELEWMPIFHELWNPSKEEAVVAYRKNCRYIPQLSRVHPASKLSLGDGIMNRFNLILPQSKKIEDLEFGPLKPLLLPETHVEIEVRAAALNFFDLFSVLKPATQFATQNLVGLDFAGVVTRVGSQVTKWTVGDPVFWLNLNKSTAPLSSHLVRREDKVLRIPENMTFCEASTLPVVLATSVHCLLDIGKLAPSDTVLVHTASGGVGLTAIQICEHVGATVIATAGSHRKRDYLRRKWGLTHVFDSRDTQFEGEVLKVTRGRGVDLVLNSLTGLGLKEASLKCCALSARFVEMSKLSIWTAEDVEQLRPDVAYSVVDLTELTESQWTQVMVTAKHLVGTQVVHPLPYSRFDAPGIREALQFLQHAKHIGKVVVAFPQQTGVGMHLSTPLFHENATYLITVCSGGIDTLLCRWMVENGARYVVLVGAKSTPPEQQREIRNINAEFRAYVKATQVDVADCEECRELIQQKIPIEFGYPLLRGIMHAAGATRLHDALLAENQTWPNFDKTFQSKIRGTWNLHQLTMETHRLEHFVLFSSTAALFGTPQQCSHAAGNRFQDNFAHYRHALGLPALSINWGAWGEVGGGVDHPSMKPLSNLQALSALKYALKAPLPQLALFNFEQERHCL